MDGSGAIVANAPDTCELHVRSGLVRIRVSSSYCLRPGEKKIDYLLAIAALLILALLFVFVRRRAPPSGKRPAAERPAKPGSTNAFHAVSIKFAPSACAAAKSLAGKRYLATVAPRIPLPECDVLECKCRFVHHEDRREGDDRRNPFGSAMGGDTGRYKLEKRLRSDRRKNSDTR